MNKLMMPIGLFALSCLFGMAGCASEEGAMRPDASGSTSGTAATGTKAKSGTVKSCVEKIPANASPGLRMIAEQSCKDEVAAGVQGDSLDACLAQIPKDATGGQRMLAEQSCRRYH